VPAVPSSDNSVYFAQTGHTLSNGFLNYWQSNGGLQVFGYPLSEEMVEDGVTVQYFERARFEYYSGLEGTPYAVQLSPMGYLALRAQGFNLPMGTLATFNPPVVAEGHTDLLTVAASTGVSVTGQYEGRPLLFTQVPTQGIAWTLIGAVPFADLGSHQVTINLQNGDGGKNTITRNLQVVPYPFPEESLQFDPQTAALLDPATTTPEIDLLNKIFSGRTPVQYWSGAFRMPLDGPITITSAFATRRCYNCPDGSAPTTYHGGMDLAADEGTPVHAPADGVVVFAGRLQVRGNAVIIDHGLGVYSLLAHNSKLIATVGQKVKQGDVVSLSGSTGLTTGPHVHWELHVSGPPVEPLEWVNRVLP
jgi:murein DD-endopeptidase MepM/ murein hydrolase activator NlpD